MTLWNSGTLVVDRPLPEDVCAKINEIFAGDVSVYASGINITFEDTPGDIMSDLNRLAALLAESDIHIAKDEAVEYYGDYEGYNVWTGSKFKSMDHGDYAVYCLTDEELCSMLRARGYCACKGPGPCAEKTEQ